MRYLAVRWKHGLTEDPIMLYSEIDTDGFERRKVDEYRNGILHSADSSRSRGTTELALVETPPVEVINADPEFEARQISGEEFETIWRRAVAQST